MIKEVPKIVSKAIFAVALTKVFGPMGIPVGIMLSEYLAESLKSNSEEVFKKIGEESGLLLAESSSKVYKFLNGGSEANPAPDFSLARLLIKTWQTRLERLIESKNFEDAEFRAQVKLLKKWRNKFREAESEENQLVIYEIFPLETSSDFGVQEKAFEALTSLKDAENNLWEQLSAVLKSWINDDETAVFQNIEEDVRSALFDDLQDDILIHLKNNEKFRQSFHTTFEFFVVDQLRTLGKSNENVEASLSELKAISDKILNSLSSQIDYSSPKLKQAVLEYLYKVSKEATKLNKIYPDEFKTEDKIKFFFNTISQRVQVVKKEQLDIYKFKLDEKERLNGSFREDNDKKIYDQRGIEPEAHQEIAKEYIKIYEWNDETRKEFKRNVILGDPGLGKSWLLCFEAQKLSTEAIEKIKNSADTPEEIAKVLKDITIPIHLRITDIAREAEMDKELVLTIAELASFSESLSGLRPLLTGYLKEKIYKRENTVLLFDALDEVPEQVDKGLTRKEIAAKISDFAKVYEKNSIFLTSRKVNYVPVNLYNENQGFTGRGSVEILAFDDKQIKNYVSVWFGERSEITENFLNLMETQTQTAGLSQNPLMLSLLCRLFYDKKKTIEAENESIFLAAAGNHFPNTRCQIYEDCLRGLLKDWKDDKSRKTISEAELKSEIRKLERTAYNLFIEGREQFTEEEFQTAFCGIKNIDQITDEDDEKSQQFLKECKADGVITETTRGKDTQYRFIHLTFQEYLTASHLAKKSDWKNFIFEESRSGIQNKILFNPDWQHTLQLLGGKLSAAEADNYIETLLVVNGKKGEGDLLFRPFTLAMRATSEAQKSLDKALLEKYWTQFFFNIFYSPEFVHSRSFSPAIRNFGPGFILYLLGLGMNLDVEKYKPLRESIILFIGLSPLSNYFIAGLIGIFLEREKDEELRQAIAYSLIGQPTISKENTLELINILETNEITGETFGVLAGAVGNQLERLPEIQAKLLEVLTDQQKDDESRQAIAKAFGRTSKLQMETVSELIKILREDENKSVKEAVLDDAIKKQKNLSVENLADFLEIVNAESDHYARKKFRWEPKFQQNFTKDDLVRLLDLFIIENEQGYFDYAICKGVENQTALTEDAIIWMVEALRTAALHRNFVTALCGAIENQVRFSEKTISLFIELLKDKEANQKIYESIIFILGKQPDLPGGDIFRIIEILKDKEKTALHCLMIDWTVGRQSTLSKEAMTELLDIFKRKKDNRFIRQILNEAILDRRKLSKKTISELFEIVKNKANSGVIRIAAAVAIKNQDELPDKVIFDFLDVLKDGRNFDRAYRFQWDKAELLKKQTRLSEKVMSKVLDMLGDGQFRPAHPVLIEIMNNQLQLSEESQARLFTMLKEQFQNDDTDFQTILNLSNLSEEIVFLCLEEINRYNYFYRESIIDSINRNLGNIKNISKAITLLKDYLVKDQSETNRLLGKKSAFEHNTAVSALRRLADKFFCAVPVEGDIEIRETSL